MLTRGFYRSLSYPALLIFFNQGSLAFANEMVSFATGGYASQLRTPEMMNKIDANGDHVVSKSEWDAYQERLFRTLDVDKSSTLEKREFMGGESKTTASFATGGFSNALRTPDMWTRFDADRDGKISHAEFLSWQTEIFDMMDTGKTHMLGQNEFFGRGPGSR
jgi:hypothetical protein